MRCAATVSADYGAAKTKTLGADCDLQLTKSIKSQVLVDFSKVAGVQALERMRELRLRSCRRTGLDKKTEFAVKILTELGTFSAYENWEKAGEKQIVEKRSGLIAARDLKVDGSCWSEASHKNVE